MLIFYHQVLENIDNDVSLCSLSMKISEILSENSSVISMGESVIQVVIRSISGGKINGAVEVLTVPADRVMKSPTTLPCLVDPNLQTLDTKFLAFFHDFLGNSPTVKKDAAIFIILSPKPALTKHVKQDPGGKDKSSSGKKRPRSAISSSSSQKVVSIDIADDDDKENEGMSDDEVEIVASIPYRMFIERGPFVSGQRLVACPNTRACAQGNWSQVLYESPETLYSNLKSIALLEQFARDKNVNSEAYDLYRASAASQGTYIYLLFATR